MAKKVFFSILLAILLLPEAVLADGMLVAPPAGYIYETDQKAVIFYQDKKEKLVISITFNGDAQHFAWIVPTPSKPQANKGSDELFASLQELTRPNYDYPKPMSLGAPGPPADYEGKVYVHETKQIDYYDIVVLSANDANALAEWLNDNGYDYPQNGRYILNDYITNGWFFTAIKINDDYSSGAVNSQFRSGHAIPLVLDFQSDKIVYPLKISSIVHQSNLENSRHYANRLVGVLLYVITGSKQQLPGFETQYAAWIKKKDIEDLAYDDNGNPWFSPSEEKYFLTRLYRRMMTSEMTSDLYLRRAKDNMAVNAPQESEPRGFTAFMVIMLLGGLMAAGLLAVLLMSGMKKE